LFSQPGATGEAPFRLLFPADPRSKRPMAGICGPLDSGPPLADRRPLSGVCTSDAVLTLASLRGELRRFFNEAFLNEFSDTGLRIQRECREEMRSLSIDLRHDIHQELQRLLGITQGQHGPMRGSCASASEGNDSTCEKDSDTSTAPGAPKPRPVTSILRGRLAPSRADTVSAESLPSWPVKRQQFRKKPPLMRSPTDTQVVRLPQKGLRDQAGTLDDLPPTPPVHMRPHVHVTPPAPPEDDVPGLVVECQADEAAGGCSQTTAESLERLGQRPIGGDWGDVSRVRRQAFDRKAMPRVTVGDSSAGRLSLTREIARAHMKKRQATKPLRKMSCADVLESSKFTNLVGTLIILNAFTIGLQTNWMATEVTDEVPETYLFIERFFCVAFLVELCIRVHVHRKRFFCCKGEGWLWNYFDVFVVLIQMIEEILTIIAKSSDINTNRFRLLRIMRILRLVRILRVVRVLRLITELRTIVSSILGSLQSLGWTVLLLFLMMYIVGVYFTQSITDYLVERKGQSLSEGIERLAVYFGSLPRTILSLFQAMSGGFDWDFLAYPLIEEVGSILMIFAFTAYIAFALLALMNVVTGVFVQTAMLNAKREEDGFLRSQIIELFNISQRDTSATITCEEIEDCLDDSSAEKEWKAIDVQPEEARHLFQLLDLQKVGEIKFEEFLSGCLRLHGDAKAFDVLTVMQELRAMSLKWNTAQAATDDSMHELLRMVMSISEVVTKTKVEETAPHQGRLGSQLLAGAGLASIDTESAGYSAKYLFANEPLLALKAWAVLQSRVHTTSLEELAVCVHLSILSAAGVVVDT